MENIVFVLNKLKKIKGLYKHNYFIPEVWNSFGYLNYKKSQDREGEICVDPYEFMIFCLENVILQGGCISNSPALASDSKKQISDYLKESTIYSMLPRMFTAWRHGDDGKVCPGTLLKAICLLPYLKKLGVDIIYLLPVFKYSDKYKKGEIGSPYAIKNIYKIDKNLHDDLLGESSESLIEVELKAFIEACHMMDMKVMLDFVFRTVARDSDLMKEHPDWFYWIKTSEEGEFSTPVISSQSGPLLLNDDTVSLLYSSIDIKDYLKKFTFDPKALDNQKWNKVVQNHALTSKNILDLIEETYGITTAPGFSDVLNDVQPPWSDVTYLKFYFDVHQRAAQYIDREQPPYILQDCVKSNLYRGKKKNEELFKYIEGVIPYYQKKYSIDGARIDMGHALPPELNSSIIQKAKEANSEFILWSEEFIAEKSAEVKKEGFHFITGTIWSVYKYLEDESFNDKLLNHVEKACLQLTAAPETADTPRVAYICKVRKKLEMVLWINAFVPKTIPFINNGLELGELQPMNLGLDNTEEGRFVLKKEDAMYGKLAFFDNYSLHWLQKENYWIYEVLNKVYHIRKEHMDIITKEESFMYEYSKGHQNSITLLFYSDGASNKNIFLAANRDFVNCKTLDESRLFNDQVKKGGKSVKILYRNFIDKNIEIDKYKLALNPGEIVLGCFE